MKDLKIMVEGKPLDNDKMAKMNVYMRNPLAKDYEAVECPVCWPSNPNEGRFGLFHGDDTSRHEIPLGPNVGRIGYFHVCRDDEEKREPIFEVGTYENGTFIPQTNT